MNRMHILKSLPKLDLGVVRRGLDALGSHIPSQVTDHQPEILTGIGLVGFGFTIVEACRATPKALALKEARTREENESRTRELMLDAKAMAPAYLKTGVSAAVSTLAIIGGNRAYAHKYGVLAASASAMERSWSLYEDKVIDRLGSAEVEKIKDEVEADCPFDDGYILDGSGKTLVYDYVTGHVFKSSREAILAAQGDVCSKLIDEMFVPLGELYFRMGLSDDFKLATGVGFTTEVKPSIHFSSTLLPDGITPKLSINYRTIPLERIFD